MNLMIEGLEASQCALLPILGCRIIVRPASIVIKLRCENVGLEHVTSASPREATKAA